MSKFSMEKPTLTFSGVFYPRGWVVLMFATPDAGRKCEADLKTGGYSADDLIFVSSADVLANVANTIGQADSGLPSVGAERGMVRQHETLARQGHVAVLAFAPSEEEVERVMTVARRYRPSFAQKYHRFAIEDLS
ncbi:RNA-binding protein [Xenophilus sp. Marseille-Q4582]|uniref:RNA-binding protein n=1 Tax=Xenophilus sp. Marseille-Q4582 TaxID=2866600 RepID=UPI001CE44B4E|nr:RNA-binding protein [Xenophilus sp. Marseille-Q4582]